METRSAKRRKLRNHNHESNTCQEDRITDLPDAVLHHILTLLPIKYIVKTSILSKRWRSLWYTFPDLDFTSLIPYGTKLTEYVTLSNIASVITNILSLRDKFLNSDVRILRFGAYLSFSGLHALARNAVRLGVLELDISVATEDIFNFPRSLITHDSLRVLKVKSTPGFRLPPSKIMRSGFQTLRELSLFQVKQDKQSSLLDMFTDSSFPQLRKLCFDSCLDLKHLRVGCRLLKELVIENCSLLQGLEVLSPKLEILRVWNCFQYYNDIKTWLQIDSMRLHTFVWTYNSVPRKTCMQNLVCLHEVKLSFTFATVVYEHRDSNKLQCLSDFLSGLSHAESLTLKSPLVEGMSRNNPLANTVFQSFKKLKSLELHSSNVTCLASVLKVCPMIHTLTINAYNPLKGQTILRDLRSSWEEHQWESQLKDLKPLLCYLKVVKIHGINDNDINLVKFLLKHGMFLQDIILYLRGHKSQSCNRHEKLISRITRLSRASVDAKLAFHY
ncbi:F-box domain, cyclin-like protein [Artemisia annua]|uniref:F-box domain, cyclin-like protein n=1 Tax=Artemisia annua TaxID=35608 RepID=A0A2U1PDA6_ARTAN|nr:F-box domain, cyclin-like protein [Artemisia annua]